MKASNIKTDELQKALNRLREVLALPKNDVVRDSAIQRFEFTVELSWKLLQKAIVAIGSPDPLAPKNVFREAARLGLVKDPESWLRFVDDRNRSSHTYRESIAEEVYSSAATLPPFVDDLLTRVQDHIKKSQP